MCSVYGSNKVVLISENMVIKKFYCGYNIELKIKGFIIGSGD